MKLCAYLGALILVGACSDSSPAEPSQPEDLGLQEDVEVAVTPSVHNTLSCVVEWRTDEPAVSWVEVARVEGGPIEFTLATSKSPNKAASHRVIVAGLWTGDFQLRPAWTMDGQTVTRGPAQPFTAAPPPSHITPAEVITLDPSTASETWVLTQGGGAEPWVPGPTTAVILDREGRVRWYAEHPTGPGSLATLINGGSAVLLAAGSVVKELDFAGETLWTSPAEPPGEYTWWAARDGSWHHDFRKLANGNYSVLRVEGGDGPARDILVEMNPDGERVWEYDTAAISEAVGTTCFGSAGMLDPDWGKAWYASRNAGIVAQVDMATKGIDWILGAKGTLAHGEGDWAWFTDPHAPVMLAKDRILLVDSSTADIGRTRVVEYVIANGVATQVWEFPPASNTADAWYTPGGGNAERLANGNTAFSGIEAGANGGLDYSGARFMEVTPEGDVVAFTRVSGSRLFYRAQRIPPLLTPIEE